MRPDDGNELWLEAEERADLPSAGCNQPGEGMVHAPESKEGKANGPPQRLTPTHHRPASNSRHGAAEQDGGIAAVASRPLRGRASGGAPFGSYRDDGLVIGPERRRGASAVSARSRSRQIDAHRSYGQGATMSAGARTVG